MLLLFFERVGAVSVLEVTDPSSVLEFVIDALEVTNVALVLLIVVVLEIVEIIFNLKILLDFVKWH